MIDVERDELVPVRIIVKQRLGKAISAATLWRWVRKGCRGVRLDRLKGRAGFRALLNRKGGFINRRRAVARHLLAFFLARVSATKKK